MTATPNLPPEFRSGNEIPVERATILRGRMEEILREAYQAGRESAQWQSIETAPQDGTPLVLFDPRRPPAALSHFVGSYAHGPGWHPQSTYGLWLEKLIPTHWMPLPPPPTA